MKLLDGMMIIISTMESKKFTVVYMKSIRKNSNDVQPFELNKTQWSFEIQLE